MACNSYRPHSRAVEFLDDSFISNNEACIVKCFQAPAGEVAEDDGEHGKSTVLYILVVKIKTFLGAPIQM